MATGPTQVRFATCNTSLSRAQPGALIDDLSTPDNPQARAVAEIIQRVNPDVLLLNEFDHDPEGRAAALLQQNYLSISHNGATPVDYPHIFLAPCNTGIPSGFDLNKDGQVGAAEDALGFGAFAGQYGMLLLSKFPIELGAVRTFQKFLWADMPGALLPDNPDTGTVGSYYSPEELAVFRLSSKSHWDVPIRIGDRIIHVLASHPTPPVFDGPEGRNRRRNHDEIRFWADYVTPGAEGYIVDDAGNRGGLWQGSFVIMGDQNADPSRGASMAGAARQLTGLDKVNTRITPSSSHYGHGTADFSQGESAAGVLRVDYVLPSADLEISDAAVFWPTPEDELSRLVGQDADGAQISSDHRLVWVDVLVGN